MGFTAYINATLADADGVPSSKRIIAAFFAILVASAFIANIGWGVVVADNILDAVMLIIIANLGITGVEKFSPYNTEKNIYPEETRFNRRRKRTKINEEEEYA